jgi:hypothetical protein
MQRTLFERAKSVAGAALVGVGMFILYGHLDRAASQLSDLLGNPGGALGALPTVVFALSRFVEAYAADHQRFLENLVKQILISAWPLLLVMVGTALSWDGFGDEGSTLPKKDCEFVDLIEGSSTLK